MYNKDIYLAYYQLNWATQTLAVLGSVVTFMTQNNCFQEFVIKINKTKKHNSTETSTVDGKHHASHSKKASRTCKAKSSI